MCDRHAFSFQYQTKLHSKCTALTGYPFLCVKKCAQLAHAKRDTFVLKSAAQIWVEESVKKMAKRVADLQKELSNIRKKDNSKGTLNAIRNVETSCIAEQTRNYERDYRITGKLEEILFSVQKCHQDVIGISQNMRRSRSSSSSSSSSNDDGENVTIKDARIPVTSTVAAGGEKDFAIAVQSTEQDYNDEFSNILLTL